MCRRNGGSETTTACRDADPLVGHAAMSNAGARRAATDLIGGMKVLVIGATGTIGSVVASALEASHRVVRASRSGPMKVDLEDPSSLDALFREVPDLDAVVCCAASGPLVDLASAADDEVAAGMRGKLLGQVALARRAVRHLRGGGSVTLTGGTFSWPAGRWGPSSTLAWRDSSATRLVSCRGVCVSISSVLGGSRRPWKAWARTRLTALPSPR